MDVAELFAEVRDSLADVFASIEWAEDEIAAAQRRWPARADALFHSFSLIRPPVELLERLSVEPVYRAYARELAQQEGWQWQEFDETTLAQKGAGAFLAVARGSADGQAAIVRLSYCPANPVRRLARGDIHQPWLNRVRRSMIAALAREM